MIIYTNEFFLILIIFRYRLKVFLNTPLAIHFIESIINFGVE